MSLSRSDTQVMLHADASRSPARAVVSIQRCDSLSAVARERRCLTAPLSRFQILASARPSTAPLPASSARAACNSTPPSAPPLPTGPNPLARARRPPKTNSLVSWTTTISRPATRAAVPLTAWQTISSVVTEPLCRKRRNRISCARLPPSRRIQEPGRTTKAACSAAPLFPGGGRQTAPAQIRPSPIPPRIDHRPTESSLQTGGNKMCAFDSRLRGEVASHRRCDAGEGATHEFLSHHFRGSSPSPQPSPREERGEGEGQSFPTRFHCALEAFHRNQLVTRRLDARNRFVRRFDHGCHVMRVGMHDGRVVARDGDVAIPEQQVATLEPHPSGRIERLAKRGLLHVAVAQGCDAGGVQR